MEKLKKGITAVLIVKNEEKMIAGCLEKLGWVDKIIVIDTGSTDETVKISKNYKARVIKDSLGKNFSDWRNNGLSKVDTEWIFYIDADERVTKSLQEEIEGIVENGSESTVYAVPRRNIVLERELTHGGWWPDYVERLFKTGSLKKWKGELHERPIYEGSLGYLHNYLIHDKHETIAEMVEKTNRWSEVEAKLMFEANHPPMNIARFASAMAREFWQRMILKQAYLDGKVGVIFAIYQVFSRFTSYAKLWEMQQKH